MITTRKITSAMRSIRKAERPDGWSHPVTIGSAGLFQSTTHSQFQRQSPTPRSSVNAGFSCKILWEIDDDYPLWQRCLLVQQGHSSMLKITSQKFSLRQNRQDRHQLPKQSQLGIHWRNLWQSFQSQTTWHSQPCKGKSSNKLWSSL